MLCGNLQEPPSSCCLHQWSCHPWVRASLAQEGLELIGLLCPVRTPFYWPSGNAESCRESLSFPGDPTGSKGQKLSWTPESSVGSQGICGLRTFSETSDHGGCWLLWASPGRSSPRSVIIVLVRALWWEDAETISTGLPLLGSSLEFPFYTNCAHRRHTIVQTPCFTGGLHSQCCAFYRFGQ